MAGPASKRDLVLPHVALFNDAVWTTLGAIPSVGTFRSLTNTVHAMLLANRVCLCLKQYARDPLEPRNGFWAICTKGDMVDAVFSSVKFLQYLQ